MKSKESAMMEIFFENPTKEWHFEELCRTAGITRSKASAWLTRFIGQGLIRKVRCRGRMPYYLSNIDAATYRNRKRIYAQERLYQSGLLDELSSLKKAKTVILFGSFARSDWHEGSDIDLFIYGTPEGLRTDRYENRLRRDIQLFVCRGRRELSRYDPELLRSIVKGILIKGDIDFLEVAARA